MENWILSLDDLACEDEDFHRSIFSLGNGYMGVRGFDEEDDRENKQEINTFIAGVFDYYAPGKTDMVNTPNFWRTDIYLAGERLDIRQGELLNFSKELNLREGILERKLVWRSPQGRETSLEFTRFLSLASVHDAVLRIRIIPLNYSGEAAVETGIDGDVWNGIIEDDQMKTDTSLTRLLEQDGNTLHHGEIHILTMRTIKTRYRICEGFFAVLEDGGESRDVTRITLEKDRVVGEKLVFPINRGEERVLCKYIQVWTSRDLTEGKLEEQVLKGLSVAGEKGWDRMRKEQAAAWDREWHVCDMEIQGEDFCQKALRFNIFQMIQTNAREDLRVNIGARGILHSRYKGCYFWDTEIFLLPFYIYTHPQAARNLLLYRYHTLEGACENARKQNLEGARFAWMSALDGLEQCDTWDIGFSEVHVTADIAYAVNHYYEATRDMAFLRDYGLELLIQTARYWKSRFTYDSGNDCYNLLFVKGPNEYGGVTVNNLYTVLMGTYNMALAEKHIQTIKTLFPETFIELTQKLAFCEEETETWREISQKAVIHYDRNKALYLEDDLFLLLEPLDLSQVKEGNKPLYETVSFDRLQRYRVLKQADVILLMLLLPERFTREEKLAAWHFYEPLTTHDSSLSFGTHAAFAARLGLMKEAWSYFEKSVGMDLRNILGNTPREGIHTGALGASWQAVFNGFVGAERKGDQLELDPILPQGWESLRFRFYYRHCLVQVLITRLDLHVVYEEGEWESLVITVRGRPVVLVKGREEQLIF